MHAAQCCPAPPITELYGFVRICPLAIGVARAHSRIVANDRRRCKPLRGHITMTIHQDQSALLARIAALEAQLASASAPKALTLKVSEKGALSIYGLGRFPVTLYRGQWERLLAAADTIRAFMTANASLLATKPGA